MKKLADFYLILMALSVLLAASLASCKARKVNKNKSQIDLVSSVDYDIKKKDSINTNANLNLTSVVVVRDSFGNYTKKTKEYFMPSATVPPNSIKSETEESYTNSVKDIKEQQDISFIDNHSEIKELDSVGAAEIRLNVNEYDKQIETKGNVFWWWFGGLVFVVGIIWFVLFRFRQKLL